MTTSLDSTAARTDLAPAETDPVATEPADAFSEFAAARAQGLKRYAYLLVGDSAEADDLVQSALLKAYLAWPRLATWGAADAYCRTIIGRSCIRVWGRRKRVLTGDVPERPVAPNEAVLAADAVWTALAALGARQRAVVVLRFYEDMTEADIASVLGISIGTVKSQLSRALGHLRRALNREDLS